MADDDKPGILERYRARFPWFDHVMQMQEHYKEAKGDFFAAAVTYYTVFALFPLAMVGFAIVGFTLSRRPELIAELQHRISAAVAGDVGNQLIRIMDTAIASRTSLGIVGLAVALWAGLGWMGNMREALSAMWGQSGETSSFVRSKLSDLTALVSTFVALALTVVATAAGDSDTITTMLGWVGLHGVTIPEPLLKLVSIGLAVLVSWGLFTWMIARLPREALPLRAAVRAGLIAAVGFELFKQVASIYLRVIMHGPAGTTFGPVLGVMVFAYITARLVLYATAWAATTEGSPASAPVPSAVPVVIAGRQEDPPGDSGLGLVVAASVGALGALGLSWLRRDR